MVERDIDFKVFRYKQGGAAPAYQTFRVRCDENTTVLVALQDIRRDQDGTLIMRHSCTTPVAARAGCASTAARSWAVSSRCST